MLTFSSIDALTCLVNPFQRGAEDDRLFLNAMRENYVFQYERHSFIRALAERNHFEPCQLQNPTDIERIPPLFVGTMKINRFCSIPEKEIALTLTSSGTNGQKTQLLLDQSSLERLNRLAATIFQAIGFASPKPSHGLVFGYDRRQALELGTSWSDEQVLGLTPVLSEHWLIRRDESKNEFVFDARETARLLIDLAEDHQPLRLLGFPAFMYEAVAQVTRLKPGLRVHPDSFVIAGGGWKNHAGAPMTHAHFAEYLEKAIGLPRANVRDTFGMAEHGVPYCSCRLGRHHVPVYSRIKVRHPLTLQSLPYGEEGVLHLYTPYNTAQPNCSVLSTDLAIVQRDCACGLPGEYLASIRRGGLTLHKGCAMAAQEILDRSKQKGK